jgi:hypothetical protein
VKIENFQPHQKKKVISLLKTNKDEQHEKNRIWDWQYIKNPAAKNINSGIVINEEGNIVGYTGFMAVDLRYNDKKLKGAWGFDTIISPQCRGKGYGDKLVEVLRHNAPIILGLGISDTLAHLLIKRGFKINTDIEQYFCIKKPFTIRDFLKIIIQRIYIIKNIYKSPIRKNLKADTLDLSNIYDEIEILWKKVEDRYTKIVKRNYSYIKWKYGSHPFKKYQCICIQNNKEIVGIGIFRTDRDMSRLVDYIGPLEDIQIKNLIIKTFKKQCKHSHLLECTCTDNELKKSLEQSGFRKFKLRPRFFIFSNIENDQDTENNWFVMGGDCDNDS